MNIIKQNQEKINGIFQTFDRMIINGYILPLQTSRLFQIIFNGKYLINVFTNKNIRQELFVDSGTPKNINRTTRLLSKLKAHGIIKK